MHKIRFLFLFLFSYIFLSGFLFEERGKASVPRVTIETDTYTPAVKKETYDDFPIIKIKAFEGSKKEELVSKKEKSISQKKESVSKKAPKLKEIKKVLPKPIKEKTHIPSRIKIKQTQAKSIKNKTLPKNKILPRRRKSGHANKLIFNKNTSIKDIPIPLPSLSSLKLKSLIKSLPTIPLSEVPILNSLLPKGSKTSHKRIKKNKYSTTNQKTSFSGNKSTLDATIKLDMGNIRIGKSKDYTTLIFDSYQWAGHNAESTIPAAESGNYNFSYEAKNNRIIGRITGYSAFSALLGDQHNLFQDSEVIKNIYIDRYIGKNSIQFIIQLQKKVKLTVLDVKNPARIIVTLYPK